MLLTSHPPSQPPPLPRLPLLKSLRLPLLLLLPLPSLLLVPSTISTTLKCSRLWRGYCMKNKWLALMYDSPSSLSFLLLYWTFFSYLSSLSPRISFMITHTHRTVCITPCCSLFSFTKTLTTTDPCTFKF